MGKKEEGKTEVRLKDLVTSFDGLVGLAAVPLDNIQKAFDIGLLIAEVKPYVEEYNKQNREVIKRIGVLKDENYYIPNSKEDEYDAAIKPLQDRMIALDLPKITLDDFKDLKDRSIKDKDGNFVNYRIPTILFATLTWLIKRS